MIPCNYGGIDRIYGDISVESADGVLDLVDEYTELVETIGENVASKMNPINECSQISCLFNIDAGGGRMTQTRDLIKKMAEFFKSEEYYEKGEDARFELSPEDVRCMNRLIHTVNLVNSSSEKLNKWIPVEKALPEEWKSVLVTDEDGEVLVAELHKNYDDTITWWGYDFPIFPKAWMSLPECYKASSTEAEGSE